MKHKYMKSEAKANNDMYKPSGLGDTMGHASAPVKAKAPKMEAVSKMQDPYKK